MEKQNKYSSVNSGAKARISFGKFYTIAVFIGMVFCTSAISAQTCDFSSSGSSVGNFPASGGQKTISIAVIGCCDIRDYIVSSSPSWVTDIQFIYSPPNASGVVQGGVVRVTVSANSDVRRSGSITLVFDGAGIGTGCSGSFRAGRILITQDGAAQIPPTPNGSISIIENNCGEATLSRSAGPPNTTITWFWQTTSNGTNADPLRASSTFTVSSNGTYYLRARSNNGLWSSSSLASPPVTVVDFAPGSISYGGATTLCYGGNPTTISSAAAPTGGDAYSYQWQSRTSTNGPFTNISGATSTTYNPPALTTTTSYRRRVNSCSGIALYSNTITINISPQVSIATGSDRSRCDSGSLLLTATPGSNANTIRWYASATGGSILATGTSYTPNVSSTTTYYAESYNSTTTCFASTREPIVAQVELPVNWYLDADGDGFYPVNGIQSDCTSPGAGWTITTKDPGDCADDDPALNPNTIWYADDDQDGFADPGGATLQQCDQPTGNWTLNPEQNPCGVSAAEKQALIDLYNATGGPSWTNTWDIINTEPCDWFGVTVVNGDVTNLDLEQNNLIGTLPNSIGDLVNLSFIALAKNQISGNLPTTFGNLINLNRVLLELNQFTGALPSTIGNLVNLSELKLNNNSFSGSIPDEIGSLSNLNTLNINQNNLTGALPSELGNLSNLRFLYLSNNDIGGSIPVELSNLSNLRYLWLGGNQLTGGIPSQLGNLTNLIDFHVERNQLTGAIPSQLGNLINLDRIQLDSNQLTGSIPIEFGNFSVIKTIQIFDNQLSGSIPEELRQLSNLNRFLFNDNNFIFSDFEADHTSYVSNIGTYSFSPQANVDLEETLSVPENESVTLTSNVLTSPNNSYQWFKDGVAIAGATSKDYVISNTTPADAGVYYFEATNSVVIGLTLTRNTITLNVEPPSVNIQRFCTMNGTPTVNDLFFPIPDDLPATWFLSETGGTALPTDTPLQNGTYWADFPGNSGSRLQSQVIIDENIPSGDQTQSFDFTTNPSLADIVVQVAAGANVLWFASSSSTTTLPNSTSLVAGQTYFAQQDDAECRLGITVSDSNPSDICIDVLVEGSAGSNVIDGTFESASNVIIPNNRNESLGNSGWGATQGTPDTFQIPYTNASDLYLKPFSTPSPNGGLCAGGLRSGSSAESLASNVFGLEAGATYIIEFYQANVSNVLTSQIRRQAFGYWTVDFSGSTKNSRSVAPGDSDAFWSRQRLEFVASTTNELLEFTVGSTAATETNAYPVYMLLDGVRVYKKPESALSTVCYPFSVQEFCTSLNVNLTIGDLVSPDGSAVTWFRQPTGGNPYLNNQSLLELPETIVWADTGSGNRSAVEVVLDLGAPTGDEIQYFDIADTPTLADIQVNGNSITWYDSPISSAVLPSSTFLLNGTVYYAAQDGNACRLAVEVSVSIPDPRGGGYQEFCSSNAPTVADLQMETTNSSYFIAWYASEEGGSPLNSTDALQSGTYYAIQTDGTDFSGSRIPTRVSVIDVAAKARTYERDLEVPAGYTIGDLTTFYGYDANIEWYDQATGGTAYFNSYQVVADETYYARVGEGLCDALQVLAVTITIGEVVEPELITCIKFIPQPGDRYVISGWVRENGLVSEPAGSMDFNADSDAQDVFKELLSKITSTILERKELPSDSFEVQSLFPDIQSDALLPYIKDFSGKKVTVYNFQLEEEVVEGVRRAIGYSFSLNPNNTDRFVYKTPDVAFEFTDFSDLSTFPRGFSYPLRNYEGLTIEYTDVEVLTSGAFRITSDFSVPFAPGSFIPLTYDNQTSDSPSSGIIGDVQLFTYTEEEGFQGMDYLNSIIELSYKDQGGTDLTAFMREMIPKGPVIDGWQRISGEFDVPSDAAYMRITLRNNGPNINAYFDDVRMHPFDSNMKSFVYDPVTQRLQAELDENNYATFYEYDSEGGLVRVKKETERGVYTIQETRSGNSKLNSGSE